LYQTKDKKWLGLSATSQNTWEGLARSMGLPELLEEPRFKDNASRLEHKDELNRILGEWLEQRNLAQIMKELVPAGGVVGPVYNIADIVDDPHYQERGDILEIEDEEIGNTRMLGVVPKFSETPGKVDHAGPALGHHNESVYKSWLGFGRDRLEELTRNGTI
jgi:crotonobetainyl-CoA:carnitine CoA-transferase CaiB-like acyl-CoA transferase